MSQSTTLRAFALIDADGVINSVYFNRRGVRTGFNVGRDSVVPVTDLGDQYEIRELTLANIEALAPRFPTRGCVVGVSGDLATPPIAQWRRVVGLDLLEQSEGTRQR